MYSMIGVAVFDVRIEELSFRRCSKQQIIDAFLNAGILINPIVVK